ELFGELVDADLGHGSPVLVRVVASRGASVAPSGRVKRTVMTGGVHRWALIVWCSSGFHQISDPLSLSIFGAGASGCAASSPAREVASTRPRKARLNAPRLRAACRQASSGWIQAPRPGMRRRQSGSTDSEPATPSSASRTSLVWSSFPLHP